MKRRIYFILILSGLAFNVRSQATRKMPGDSTIITRIIPMMPHFIGGPVAYAAFLKANIHYPAQALADKLEGRAIVTFVVEKDGHLSNIKLSHDPGEGLGEEAVRVLKSSPKWSPGMMNNMPVRVRMLVFVTFTLPK